MLDLDLTTIAFQLVNFIVLAVGLYFLLFKRIIKKADQRNQELAAMHQETLRNLEESEKIRAQAEEYLKNINLEVDKNIDQALKDLEAAHQEVLQQTKAEVDEVFHQRREDTVHLQRRIIEEFQQDLLDTIIQVSLHTLQLAAPEELHHTLLNQMNESVWDLGKSDMHKVESIRKSLENREPLLMVESPLPLSKEEKALLTRTFSALADKNIKMELKIHKELVAGLKVRLGDLVVDNTLSSKLEEISESTKASLQEKFNQLKADEN